MSPESKDAREQRQDIDAKDNKIAREACYSFMKRAKGYARYSDRLELAYQDVDAFIETMVIPDSVEDADEFRARARRKRRKRARDILSDDETVEPHPPSIAIITPPGTGKTYHMIRAFNEIAPGPIDLHMPTVAMADEFKERAPEGSNLVVEAARSSFDPEYNKPPGVELGEDEKASEVDAKTKGHQGRMCPNHARADALAAAYVPVTGVLCRVCQHKDWCGYLRQGRAMETNREEGGGLIRTHARLYTGSLADRAPIKVIDESLIDACLRVITFQHFELTPEHLEKVIDPFEEKTTMDEGVEDMLKAIGEPGAVKKAILSTERLGKLCSLIQDKIKARTVDLDVINDSASQLNKRIERYGLKLMHEVVILIKQIEAAFDADVELSTLVVGPNTVSITHVDLPDIKTTDSVMLLDATFRPAFASIIFGDRKFEIHGEQDHEPGLISRHMPITATREMLLGPKDGEGAPVEYQKAWNIRQEVMRQAVAHCQGGRALLVSNDAVLTAFAADGLPYGWDMANFANVQGRNEWEDFDAVVIVGQAMPEVSVLEKECAAYLLASGKAEKIPTADDWFKENGVEGKARSLLPRDHTGGYFHPSPIVWEMVQSKVHDKYIQAAGRIRANQSKTPKRLFLASVFQPEGLGIVYWDGGKEDYEKWSRWQQYLFEKMYSQGWVLRSAAEAAIYHGVNVSKIKNNMKGKNADFDGQLLEKRLQMYSHQKVSNLPAWLDKSAESTCEYEIGWSPFKVDSLKGRSPYLVSTRVFQCSVRAGRSRKIQTLFHLGAVAMDQIQAVDPTVELVEFSDPRSDFVTVLETAEGKTSTKRFEKKPSGHFTAIAEYDAGSRFSVDPDTPTPSIDELSRKLIDLETKPRKFVIRGGLKAGMMRHGIPRRIKSKRGDNPFLEEVPRSWMMLDIDEFPIPFGHGIADDGVEAVAQMMVLSLPEPLRSTTCHVAMSSSCGLKDNGIFKGHVWFMLDKAMTSNMAKRWLLSLPDVSRVGKGKVYEVGGCKVDTSTFTPVQPHYTANPIIEGDDPFPVRSWLLRGQTDVVAVTMSDPMAVASDEVERPPLTYDAEASRAEISFQISLFNIGDGLGGFQDAILKASRPAHVLVETGQADMEDVITRISDQVRAADPGTRSPEEIARYADRDFIRQKIKWWVDVFTSDAMSN